MLEARTGTPQETALLDAAVAWLGERLPASWEVRRSRRAIGTGDGHDPVVVDGAIELKAPNGTSTTIAVEARRSFAPRDVETLLPALARSLRLLAGNVPLLVVAPWLSPRTRELLAREQLNFLDLTGNARLELGKPAVFLETTGSARNPNPPTRGRATVRGPRAARLIRLLADVRPPYGVRELAMAAELTPGYVSRLLDALDRDALVDRGHRGQVIHVDVPALLRAWADGYDLFARDRTSTWVARDGATEAVRCLAGIDDGVVTGSFAAVRIAPVAAPSLLAVFCRDPQRIASAARLLPADDGVNVALIRPFDDVVFARTVTSEDVRYAAPSQVAVDCLAGNGRMPAEGEALLEWMAANEPRWRLSSLAQLKPAAHGG